MLRSLPVPWSGQVEKLGRRYGGFFFGSWKVTTNLRFHSRLW